MPEETLLPTADSAVYDQWSRVGAAATKWESVADDVDGNYIQEGIDAQEQAFTVSSLTGQVGSINWIKINHRSQEGGPNATIDPFTYAEATQELYGATALAVAWADYDSGQQATKPAGGPWTEAIVNATEIGVKAGIAGDVARCTKLTMSVDYDVKSGGFAYLLAQWLPPLLALASHGLTKFDITRILSSLKTRPSNDEDFARIIEAFRRRPVWLV